MSNALNQQSKKSNNNRKVVNIDKGNLYSDASSLRYLNVERGLFVCNLDYETESILVELSISHFSIVIVCATRFAFLYSLTCSKLKPVFKAVL